MLFPPTSPQPCFAISEIQGIACMLGVKFYYYDMRNTAIPGSKFVILLKGEMFGGAWEQRYRNCSIGSIANIGQGMGKKNGLGQGWCKFGCHIGCVCLSCGLLGTVNRQWLLPTVTGSVFRLTGAIMGLTMAIMLEGQVAAQQARPLACS